MNEKQMTAKLYECRELCKEAFGVEWREKLKQYFEWIKSEMQRWRINEIEAAYKIIFDHESEDQSGAIAIMFFAAAIELIEPSKD